MSLTPFRLASAVLATALVLQACSTLPSGEPEGPADDVPVMGTKTVALDRFLTFVLARNPDPGQKRWTEVWTAYREACRAEGVSQGVALVQMLHETGYLRFGGTVQARQNNFAGLGTVDRHTPGLSFPDVRTGALAHVQHLKAYGSSAPLSTTLVDPRFRYVKRGSAPTVRALTGKWAADPLYGDKLMALWNSLQDRSWSP